MTSIIELKPDRRREHRHPLRHECKIFHRPSRRYIAAETHNISTTGALIEVKTSRPLSSGETIELLVDLKGGPILFGASPVAAEIVRVDSWNEQHQTVGVRFETPISLANAA